MHRPAVLLILAALIACAFASDANAQPTSLDIRITWDTDSPTKVGGNLVMSGTITFANGWMAVGSNVFIEILPKNGGVSRGWSAPIVDGKWKIEKPLALFPAPAQI